MIWKLIIFARVRPFRFIESSSLGLTFQTDTKVIINGIEKGVSFINGDEIVVYGFTGRIPAAGEMNIQIRNSNGGFSNVSKTEIRELNLSN